MGQRIARALTDWIPRGEQIDEAAFAERHRILTWFLALHLPALLVFGMWMDQALVHVLVELATPTVMVALATMRQLPQRYRGLATTAGLVYVSAVVVHFSGGTIEGHFHFFIILGFIALYQDWMTFAWAILFTLLSHGVMGTIDPASMYNHEAAINGPWKWALIHAAAVALAAIGQLLHWRFAELERARSTELSANLAEEKHRSSLVRLYVNLARRNRGLLAQQVEAIDALEADEQDPDILERLFRLDHVTARLRRHTDSLLVLANQQTSRSRSGPVTVRDIVRAAAADCEHYERVEVVVDGDLSLVGPAVSDVTHLVTELLENALSFSPPDSTVVVGTRSVAEGAVLVIQDRGIGMSPGAMQQANRKLGEVTTLEDGLDPQLGLHVVARLSVKHGVRVRLQPGREGGTIALVLLPHALHHAAHGTNGSRVLATGGTPAATPAPTSAPAASPAPAPAPAPAPTPPPAAPAPATSTTAPASASPSGLPQRVPGRSPATSGSQPIRGAFGDAGDSNGHDDVAARSQRLSAFQAATRAGRSEQGDRP